MSGEIEKVDDTFANSIRAILIFDEHGRVFQARPHSDGSAKMSGFTLGQSLTPRADIAQLMDQLSVDLPPERDAADAQEGQG
jgi:hypothetical protein